MGQAEHEAVATETRRTDAAQRESDHHRWADDGGFVPEPEAAQPAAILKVITRRPWLIIGIAAGVGFALGWLTGRRK